jgi:arginyl-tRNA synthetase
VQYAHARISSILRKAEDEGIKYQVSSIKGVDLNSLNNETELSLIKELIKFPELVEDVAKNYEIHRLPYYAQDLARKFHSFYNSCQVIGDDKDITISRLALVMATKIVLNNILDLMGVSAPEKM